MSCVISDVQHLVREESLLSGKALFSLLEKYTLCASWEGHRPEQIPTALTGDPSHGLSPKLLPRAPELRDSTGAAGPSQLSQGAGGRDQHTRTQAHSQTRAQPLSRARSSLAGGEGRGWSDPKQTTCAQRLFSAPLGLDLVRGGLGATAT